MWRKIFWFVVTLGTAGVAWWLLEQRETRGFWPDGGEQPQRGPGRETDPAGHPSGQAGARRCIAVTLSGSRCTREAQEGSDLCWQHA